MDSPIYLRDLFPCEPIEPARLSREEIQRFVEEVKGEMDRRGFTEANRRTEESQRLTGEDYNVIINC